MLGDFDLHIAKSIPNYELLSDSILRLSDYFKVDGKNIYDLGCSTGRLLKQIGHNGRKIGYDNCKALLPSNSDGCEFIFADLNKQVSMKDACIVYSVFTMQFLRKEVRAILVKDVYDALCLGGAFIFAEKVYGQDSMTQDMFTFSYYDYKKSSFTEKEILDKESSLRGVLKPMTSAENTRLVTQAGFERIVLFYKYFNFEAYVCIK